jgi:hypothetical protein
MSEAAERQRERAGWVSPLDSLQPEERERVLEALRQGKLVVIAGRGEARFRISPEDRVLVILRD